MLLCLAVAISLGFAPAPFPRPNRHRENPTAVTGTWEFVLWEHQGMPTKANYTIEMTPQKFDFVSTAIGGGRTSYVMRLHPALSPHGFEWHMGGRLMYVGSYRLKGNEITMIFTHAGRLEQRPTDFKGKPQFRFVMRRIKR
jgi:uncharacterized protein (TIGR03067 family)